MASGITMIKASYIIAFDGVKHAYLKDGELAFQNDAIVYVGEKYDGPADRTIDSGLVARQAGLVYPIRDDLPLLLPEDAIVAMP